MENYTEIIEKIENAKNVILISHIGPDGDTIGSTLAFANLIKENFTDKKIDYVIQYKVPDIYQFLPNTKGALLTNRDTQISCYDLAIAIDCAAKNRMGYFESIFDKAKFKINIDHHQTNNSYGDINIIDGNASSSGEVIYYLTEKFNWTISTDTAISLYTAILTDTGAFRYSNTTSKTLYAASKLVEKGADSHMIYEKCFENRPLEMLKISSAALNNAIFCANNKIAYTVVDRKMLGKFEAKDEHLEGIPEILRQASCVEIAFVLKETVKGEAKFSFRSKSIDVSSLCELFGGGGHKLAAGCIMQTTLDEALNKILPEVEKLVK